MKIHKRYQAWLPWLWRATSCCLWAPPSSWLRGRQRSQTQWARRRESPSCWSRGGSCAQTGCPAWRPTFIHRISTRIVQIFCLFVFCSGMYICIIYTRYTYVYLVILSSTAILKCAKGSCSGYLNLILLMSIDFHSINQVIAILCKILLTWTVSCWPWPRTGPSPAALPAS